MISKPFNSAQYHREGVSILPLRIEKSLIRLTCKELLEAFSGEFPAQPKNQQNLHLKFESLFRLATHPLLLNAMEALIGGDILLLGTKLRNKPPHQSDGRMFPWHQDSAYWNIDPPEALSAWIAIDDQGPANGCLWIIPRSHKKGIVQHVKSHNNNELRHKYELPTSLVNESDSTPLALVSGQIAVFHSLLFHKSEPNQSNDRRCTLLVRFVAPSVQCTNRKYDAIQVKGKDNFGNFRLINPPFPHESYQ